MAKSKTVAKDEVEVEYDAIVCDPDPKPRWTPVQDPGAREPPPEDVETTAKAIYSAIMAHHGNRYPRSNKQGDWMEPWEQLTPNELDAFRNAAFAVLTGGGAFTEPEPEPEP